MAQNLRQNPAVSDTDATRYTDPAMTHDLAIDLWIWSLAPPCPPSLSAVLTDAEEARAARFVNPDHGHAYRIGRGQLRTHLGALVDLAPRDVPLRVGSHGKPFLEGGPIFNLSHSGGWAALAITPQAVDLGLDIEAHRPVEPGVAHRFFSPTENADLASGPSEDWLPSFFRCWTRKEAIVKAIGDGLTLPLDQFDVTLRADQPAQITHMASALGSAAEWRLTHLDLGTAMTGAIALRDTRPMTLHWHGAQPPLEPR